MKGCELCSYPARIYCEADQASLCSNCDEKVHSANFLVAKHSRCLLCHVCQSPTQWKASGTKLGTTVSVCDNCVNKCSHKQGRGGEREEESQGRNGDDETDDDFGGEEDDCSADENSGEDGEIEEGSGEDDEDEDGGDNNQVVPWSSSPLPPVATSSSSEEVSSSTLKRTREAADLDSEDEIGTLSSRLNHNIASMAMSSQALENDEANFTSSRTSLKLRRPNELIQSEGDKDLDKLGSRSVAMMVSSLRKLQRNTMSDNDEASAMILGICRLSLQRADLVFQEFQP